MAEDCIFCKIINGDFNTEFVYENDYVVVFKDINPKAPIHLLVVPKTHVASLNELEDKNLMAELLMAVKETTKKIGLKSYKTQEKKQAKKFFTYIFTYLENNYTCIISKKVYNKS